MYKLNRRNSILFVAAAAIGTGISADPAHAAAGPVPAISVATPPAEPVGLLLPAVQKVREAAARMKC